MAEKGFMLTQFEECFGSVVEHEVIKGVLQEFGWDPAKAIEALTVMADMTNIPPHILAKLNALQKGPGGRRSNSSSPRPGNGSRKNPQLCDAIFNLDSKKGFKNGNSKSGRLVTGSNGSIQNGLENGNHAWQQQKSFKSNNSNVNCKVTNLSQNPSFNNEHRTYDKFLSNSSQLSKGSSISRENETLYNSGNSYSGAKKATCMVEVLKAMLDNGTKLMVIMRGLPGSGKSTLAKEVASTTGVVLSADDFFTSASGVYNFDPSKLSLAHSGTQNRAKACLKKNRNPIVIDNTNLQAWEMKPYVAMALECGYKVEFLEPDTAWKLNPRELARKTRHGVPRDKIEEMLSRFDRNIKLKDFVFDRVNSGVGSSHIPKVTNEVANSFNRVNQAQNGGAGLQNNAGFPEFFNNMDKIDMNSKEFSDRNVTQQCSPKPILKDMIDSYKSSMKSDYLVPSRESSPGDVDSVRFNEMVQSFGTEVKKKMNGDSSDHPIAGSPLNTTEEDFKMYQFCEDIEDKLGNSIPSLIRQHISKESTDSKNSGKIREDASEFPSCSPNRDSVPELLKVPALYTLTEELTRDMSGGTNKTADDSGDDCSDKDDTSNDASSVELVRDDGSDREQSSVPQVDSWNCLGGVSTSAGTDWEEVVDEMKEMTVSNSRPLQVEQSSNPSIRNETGLKVEQECVTGAADSWVAEFGSTNGEDEEEDYDAKMMVLRKTGAVPKRSKERQRRPVSIVDEQSSSQSRGSEDKTKYGLCKFDNMPSEASTLQQPPLRKFVDVSMQTAFNETLTDGSLKILYGCEKNFKLGAIQPSQSTDGPITKGCLYLDKGTMTTPIDADEPKGSIEQLKPLFPHLAETELQDILSTCNDDVDWATNVLLDGGYQISDGSSDVSKSPASSTSPTPGVTGTNGRETPQSDDCSSSALEIGPLEITQANRTCSRKKKKRAVKAVCSGNLAGGSRRAMSDEDELLPDEPNSWSTSDPTTQTKRTVELRPQSRDGSVRSGAGDDSMQCLSLQLDPYFSSRLLDLFGPVGNLDSSHKFDDDERKVFLPISLCREIHKAWNQSRESDNKYDDQIEKSLLDADAALARQLQDQEDRQSRNASPKYFQGFEGAEPPTRLKEIMELEKALQVSSKKEPINDLSFKLSEKRLCEEYSHVDSTVVKKILLDHDGNYAEATTALLSSFGIANRSAVNLEAAVEDTRLIKQEDERWRRELDEVCSDQEDPERCAQNYDHYRSMRKRLLTLAQQATGPHKSEVARHYAEEANKYGQKMYEARLLCSKKLVEQQNADSDANTLDLHKQSIQSAIMACDAFLEERARALRSVVAGSGTGRKLTLNIITGWGKHSHKNKGKLKPAVLENLTRKGYRVTEHPTNPGMLCVALSV